MKNKYIAKFISLELGNTAYLTVDKGGMYLYRYKISLSDLQGFDCSHSCPGCQTIPLVGMVRASEYKKSWCQFSRHLAYLFDSEIPQLVEKSKK